MKYLENWLSKESININFKIIKSNNITNNNIIMIKYTLIINTKALLDLFKIISLLFNCSSFSYFDKLAL